MKAPNASTEKHSLLILKVLKSMGLVGLADSMETIEKYIDYIESIESMDDVLTFRVTSDNLHDVLYLIKRSVSVRIADSTRDHVDVCVWRDNDALLVQVGSRCRCVLLDDTVKAALSDSEIADLLPYAYIYKVYVSFPQSLQLIPIDKEFRDRIESKYEELLSKILKKAIEKATNGEQLCIASSLPHGDYVHVTIKDSNGLKELLRLIEGSIRSKTLASSTYGRTLVTISMDRARSIMDYLVTEAALRSFSADEARERIYRAILLTAMNEDISESIVSALSRLLTEFRKLDGVVISLVSALGGRGKILERLCEALHIASDTSYLWNIIPLILQELLLMHLYLTVEHRDIDVGGNTWSKTKELLTKMQDHYRSEFESKILKLEERSEHRDMTKLGITAVIRAIINDLSSLQKVHISNKPTLENSSLRFSKGTLYIIHGGGRREYSVGMDPSIIVFEEITKNQYNYKLICPKDLYVLDLIEDLEKLRELFRVALSRVLDRVVLHKPSKEIIDRTAQYRSIKGNDIDAILRGIREANEFCDRIEKLKHIVLSRMIPRSLALDKEIDRCSIKLRPIDEALVLLEVTCWTTS